VQPKERINYESKHEKVSRRSKQYIGELKLGNVEVSQLMGNITAYPKTLVFSFPGG